MHLPIWFERFNNADRCRFYLISIIVIAALLRLPFLSSNPNGFLCDEASIGYDAYSILNTGRDQYGGFLPLFSRSFSDYDESLYRWLVVPFVYLGNLSEFTVRLPAALIGILTIWMFYRLALSFFDQKVALMAGLLLAISPWHIQFSRWGVRAILLPFFVCAGLLAFQKGLRKPRYLLLSALSFGIGLHTYNSARVFIPIFILVLLVIHWNEIRKIGIWLLFSSILFLGILTPLFFFWISPEGMARANTLLVLDPILIFQNYVSYFKPTFLFFEGDPNLRHSLRNFGQLHYFECFTVLGGIVNLVKQRNSRHRILWFWLLLYPIPAALTEPEHAIRSIMGAPLFALLSGSGFFYIANAFNRRKRFRSFAVGSAAIITICIGFFSKQYYWDYPIYSASWWQYGAREVIEFTQTKPYPCIFFGKQPTYLFPPYIFVLFYTRFSPSEYLQASEMSKLRLWIDTAVPVNHKYYTFQDLMFQTERALIVVSPKDLSEIQIEGYAWREVHTIHDLQNKELLKIIEIYVSR